MADVLRGAVERYRAAAYDDARAQKSVEIALQIVGRLLQDDRQPEGSVRERLGGKTVAQYIRDAMNAMRDDPAVTPERVFPCLFTKLAPCIPDGETTAAS